jgi:CxxC motif-containing protein
MEKQLICVSCPVGCPISVKIEGGEVVDVKGNRCARGDAYARQEAIDPVRVLPTSVKVVDGTHPLVSVKTDKPVPKRLIHQIMNYIKSLSVDAPVEIGQAVSEDVLGTGANLIATRKVPRLKG